MLPKFLNRAIAAFILTGCLSLLLWAQQNPGGLTPPPPAPKSGETPRPGQTASDQPFQVGERLSFNVSWANFVTAARLDLEVARQGTFFGQEGFQLRTKVETVGYVRSIFTELDNEYVSFVDAKSLLPFRVDNTTRQGQKNEEQTINLDQQRHVARYGDGSEVQVPPSTYDLPALIYSLRKQDLKPGASAKFSALFGKQVVSIEAQPKQRERITTQAGNYEAQRVDFSGKAKNGANYRVQIWFSTDAQRLPVLIYSRTPFGEVRAELTQVTVSDPSRVPLSPTGDKQKQIAMNGGPIGKPVNSLPIPDLPPMSDRILPFAVGERLSYDVSYLNFGAIGKVNFEVRQQGQLNNRYVLELVSEASTVGPARSVFNLNDSFTSYVDLATLAPLKTETQLSEGKRRKSITADYNADQTVRLVNGTHFAVPPQTLDLVSLFYSIRAAELKIGSSHSFAFLDTNHRLNKILIRVVKQETINSALGPRETLQLDVFNPDSNQLFAQAWVSNDARRLPLYVAARLAFGELRLNITKTTNLR